MNNSRVSKLSDWDIQGAKSEVYLMDCIEAMKQYPDKYFDLAVVDPPYGINVNMNAGRRKDAAAPKRDNKKWDNEIPAEEYFKELFRVSQNQIIWGGNYFTDHLKPTPSWVFWDKQIAKGVSFADGELAWTSFDTVLRKAVIPYSGFIGADKDGRIHPTQKSVSLYDWIFKNYAKEGDLILDTHAGSMSSVIAALENNLSIVSYEIDKDYFESGKKRVENHFNQMNIFRKKPILKWF